MNRSEYNPRIQWKHPYFIPHKKTIQSPWCTDHKKPSQIREYSIMAPKRFNFMD